MKQFFLILGVVFLMTSNGFAEQLIKQPNVAGVFYPANPKRLASDVQRFLAAAPNESKGLFVEMVLSPHAGYPYAGRVDGYAYKQLMSRKGKVHTVVILAPSHYFGFPGISVWAKGGYHTPLGTLMVDEDFAKKLIAKDPLFVDDPRVYQREHSLEVELPFIQEIFSNKVKIVPVIMGQASFETCRKVAKSLNELIGKRDDVAVVLSSDMSHYHADQVARLMDGQTLRVIAAQDAWHLWEECSLRRLEMCGFVPVTTGILLAKERGLDVKILKYANSGDVTPNKNSVVGYGAAMFYRPPKTDSVKKDAVKKDPAKKDSDKMNDGGGVAPLTLDEKRQLMDIAKKAVNLFITKGDVLQLQPETDPRLEEIEGAFVTLTEKGRLRGCIGNIVGRKPLYLTVRDMAIAAASSDSRFSPVTAKDLPNLHFEISVLSRPRRINSPDEIKMGVHGVIVSLLGRQGVFLPQVAKETGWDRDTFLSQLCSQKAGLPANAWKDPRTELQVFTATVFSEKDVAKK